MANKEDEFINWIREELGAQNQKEESKIKEIVRSKLQELETVKRKYDKLDSWTTRTELALREKVFWFSWLVVVFGLPLLVLLTLYIRTTLGDVPNPGDLGSVLFFLTMLFFILIPVFYALCDGIVQMDALKKG